MFPTLNTQNVSFEKHLRGRKGEFPLIYILLNDDLGIEINVLIIRLSMQTEF